MKKALIISDNILKPAIVGDIKRPNLTLGNENK